MKLKGDLNAISLSELLTTLSDQRATGVLSVTSPMGEKHIVFSHGEVIVFSDPLAERTRLGDLLVAQGRLAREKLEEALRTQAQASPRPRLGDVLTEQGFVKLEDIQEAIKFQVEEEISDLFTWREASFDFDGDRTLEEFESELWSADGAPNVHRLSIDPQILILEAARRAQEWREIGERLPTPYLCFKITGKGEEQIKQASPTLQRILRLIREGRTLENVVKLSCLGRFTVSKAVIRILDDNWIIPYSAPELPYLADEHRLQRRYADALNIYRRLLEVARSPSDREELNKQIEQTILAIRKARTSGEAEEGVEVLSHKKAAVEYKERRRRRYWFFTASAIVACLVVAGGVFWRMALGRHFVPPDVYNAAVDAADAALAEGRFEEGIAIWTQLSEAIPAEEAELGEHVRERLARVIRQYGRHMDTLFEQAQLLEKDRPDQAREALLKIQKDYPHNPLAEHIARSVEKLDARVADGKVQQVVAARRQILREARAQEDRKSWQRAREIYAQALEGAPAAEIRKEAEDGLARLNAVAERLKGLYQTGLEQVQARKGDQAIQQFETVQLEWPESEWGQKAREAGMPLRMRRTQLQEGLAAARAAEDRGDLAGARDTLQRLQREFAEFEEARAVKTRVENLSNEVQNAEGLLARAVAAEKENRSEEARELFDRLLRERRGFLAARPFGLPVRVASIPVGAQVFLNGQDRGRAPLRLEVPVDQKLEFRLELPGFEPRSHVLTRVSAEDLIFTVRLDRTALRRLDLTGPSLAPPVLHGERLYVAAGASLVALDPQAQKTFWRTPPLVDERGAAPLFQDPAVAEALPGDRAAWTYLRYAPLALDNDRLVVLTPVGELVEVRTADGSARRLLKLPAVPVVPPLLQRGALSGGRAVVVCACADGKVRGYDPDDPKAARWEAPADAGGEAKALVGLAAGGPGSVVSASREGVLCGWSLALGQKTWTLELNAAVTAAARPAEAGGLAGEVLGAFITAREGLVAVDLARGSRLWELTPGRAAECITAASLGPEGLCAITRDGLVRYFPRTPLAGGKAKPVWERALDGPGPAPWIAGERVLAATRTGTVSALGLPDGRELWRYKANGRPSHLAVWGKVVYVVTVEGQLILLHLE